MALTAMGYVTCGECGDHAAEVKQTKKSHLMIYCPMCRTQTFARDKKGDDSIKARMRPLEAPKTPETPQEKAPREIDTKPPADVPKVDKLKEMFG